MLSGGGSLVMASVSRDQKVLRRTQPLFSAWVVLTSFSSRPVWDRVPELFEGWPIQLQRRYYITKGEHSNMLKI